VRGGRLADQHAVTRARSDDVTPGLHRGGTGAQPSQLLTLIVNKYSLTKCRLMTAPILAFRYATDPRAIRALLQEPA
jgi:hypothetical protein